MIPVLLAGCVKTAELTIALDPATSVVGSPSTATLTADVEGKKDAILSLSVLFEGSGDATFTVDDDGGGVVSDDTPAANESPIVDLVLAEAHSTVTVAFRVNCAAELSGEIVGAYRILEDGSLIGGGTDGRVPYTCK